MAKRSSFKTRQIKGKAHPDLYALLEREAKIGHLGRTTWEVAETLLFRLLRPSVELDVPKLVPPSLATKQKPTDAK